MHILGFRHSYSPFFPLGLEGFAGDFVSLELLEDDDESEEAAFVSELLLSLPLLSPLLLSDEELEEDLLSAEADFLYDSLR